ncbi:hypothetical protein BH10ACI4_BH10ACI4_12330 [soil metagenome]
MHTKYLLTLLVASVLPPAQLQADPHPAPLIDSDHDGLADALEQSLLTQFAPKFMVGLNECANLPAEFVSTTRTSTVALENATIYGQAAPANTLAPAQPKAPNPTVELHYYHLWKQDCGPHGHPLDAEHVSVLIHDTGTPGHPHWRALYWYAAAHENTVCDVSQITRAATLKAEDKGTTVWISPGKHASFLNQELCRRGCGADRCEAMRPLDTRQIVNLGELAHPMNGALWSASSQWPLADKMTHTNFPAEPIVRLESLPLTDIAWFSPGRHPAQGIIAISSTTANALGTSQDSTLTAISVAGDNTGNALGKSYRKTIHALGTSTNQVGKALRLKPKPDTQPRSSLER